MTCAVCGRPLPDDARFCPGCGAAVTSSLATDERKIVTVLFADLVDSTALAQHLDAERAREVLGRFYDAATQELLNLRGRPEKFIGDAVMAVFGLHKVHEDDALRAVRAGLAIRARARRMRKELGLDDELQVRVGIEAGEAATGTGPSEQLLVTGSVVNAAARLQTAAEPGEVLVGGTAHALTGSTVSFGDRRDVDAKGFEERLEAYPVAGLTTRSVRRTIPFVGRDDELTRLRETVHSVTTSSTPTLVTILGEAGSGKSRLADELFAGLDPGIAVLHGHAQVPAGSASFAPVAAILRQLAGIDENGEPDTIGDRLRELVDGCCDPSETERVAAGLGLTLGLAEPSLDESVFVQDVQGGFMRLIDGLSSSLPVVLAFEDAHELAPPMLDLIERLVSDRRRGATLVLTLARSELLEARPTWGAGAAAHVEVLLGPLTDEAATDLVRQAGGDRIADRDAAIIAERAGGNPFFIVETTGMLLREGQDRTGAVPPTVQAVIAARIDSLPAPSRDLARRSSVFLSSFDLDEIRSLMAADPDRADGDAELRRRLEELEDSELLVRVDDDAPRWRFRHQTLRDVAYASLPKRLRRELHLTVADRLQADDHRSWAAEHLEQAALASLDLEPTSRMLPDRAADALAEAGDRARRRMENRSALDRYRRALTMAGTGVRWGRREARVLAGMGEAFYWLGEYRGATEVLERAVDLGSKHGDDVTLAIALRFLGDISINVAADVDRAEELLGRSLEAAERSGDPGAISRTLLFSGWVPWTRNDLAEAETIWRRALEIAEATDDRWALVRSLCSLSIVIGDQGRLDEATETIERARDVAIDMGDRFSLAVATVQEGRLHEERKDYERSLPYFDRGIEIFTELGARWELGDALAERGIAARELGRLDDAERDLRQAIAISEELGERQLAGWTWRALAHVTERRGDPAKAEAHRRRAEQEESRRPH
ncbi:MAG: AAA family ATPase [Actinomycetota bacterium]|nr:AAA family ATPase [Actinomycetota bacterium]